MTIAGPEMDRELQTRVFGADHAQSVPPFSTRDWTALALAELVTERTNWRYQLVEQDGLWTAIWFERGLPKRRVAAMVTARASTRALALCRALMKATRSPRWTPGRAELPQKPRLVAAAS